MQSPTYWKRYVVDSDPDEIAARIATKTVESGGATFELIHFERGPTAPSILISPGSGGHAYVFAELGARMNERGYNVFIMPRHGGRTIAELVSRHEDAVTAIASMTNERIGVFGEGLGGFVTFYLALGHGRVRSIACQNSPAILTEPRFHEALAQGKGAARRRKAMLRGARLLTKVAPNVPIPIATYLDFREMVDPSPEGQRIEAPMIDAYLHDPDFDRSYPLAVVMSLVSTPAPHPIEDLDIPTMFIVPSHGFAPAYTKELFARLPDVEKKLVEVEGSVFWMVSHPREAAKVICEWFDETV